MISCLACLRSSATRKAEERSGSGSRLYGVTTPNQIVTRKRLEMRQSNQQVTGAYNLAAKREAVRIAQATILQQVTDR